MKLLCILLVFVLKNRGGIISAGAAYRISVFSARSRHHVKNLLVFFEVLKPCMEGLGLEKI